MYAWYADGFTTPRKATPMAILNLEYLLRSCPIAGYVPFVGWGRINSKKKQSKAAISFMSSASHQKSEGKYGINNIPDVLIDI
jgi:hypothetical protein